MFWAIVFAVVIVYPPSLIVIVPIGAIWLLSEVMKARRNARQPPPRFSDDNPFARGPRTPRAVSGSSGTALTASSTTPLAPVPAEPPAAASSRADLDLCLWADDPSDVEESCLPEGTTPPPPPRVEAPQDAPGWERRWLDNCDSPAEEAFLKAAIGYFRLKPNGDALHGDIKLQMQHSIGLMHVDFLVNDVLVVEVDGHKYHARRNKTIRDGRRDQHLRRAGYRVHRVPAYRVFNDPTSVMRDIEERNTFGDEILD